MRDKLVIPQVTKDSSDGEIIIAINAAGEHRYDWRRDDWPEKGEKKAWVKPQDIGESNRRPGGDALLKRLRKMVTAGLLEERTYSNMPRFRAVAGT